MSQLREVFSFATGLYRQRAAIGYAGHVRRDPMAQLLLRRGRENPYEFYDRLRRDGALSATRLGFWAITGHRLCGQVLRDRRFGVRVPEGSPETSADGFDLSFLDMDPPDHTRLRRVAQPAFSPKQMTSYQPRIEKMVADMLDRAEETGSFDLVSALASPLPVAVIADLLGVPQSDAANFARYGAVVATAVDGIRSLSHAAKLKAANDDLTALFERLIALRRREPADDLVSRLIEAEGDQIRPAELLPMCSMLLLAGFETTVNLIGNAVNALLDHPEQWDSLCTDPAAMAPKAVEEALRFDPPVQRCARIAHEPVELEGQALDKGTTVVMLLGAANRDPEAYPDPDRFDIQREQTADHLAFASGIHYCLGQPLARLEASIALRSLAERMPRLRRDGRAQRRDSGMVRGLLRLPVQADARAHRAPAADLII